MTFGTKSFLARYKYLLDLLDVHKGGETYFSIVRQLMPHISFDTLFAETMIATLESNKIFKFAIFAAAAKMILPDDCSLWL